MGDGRAAAGRRCDGCRSFERDPAGGYGGICRLVTDWERREPAWRPIFDGPCGGFEPRASASGRGVGR